MSCMYVCNIRMNVMLMYVCMYALVIHSFHTHGFEWMCSVGCQEGNESLHLFRPAWHTCRRRCRTCTAMWYYIVVISFYVAINCGSHNIDTRLFLFEVRRAVFIAVNCICAVINHSSQNQWQCLMQTKTRTTYCVHSTAVSLMFYSRQTGVTFRWERSVISFLSNMKFWGTKSDFSPLFHSLA
jgi:hypothetical protein